MIKYFKYIRYVIVIKCFILSSCSNMLFMPVKQHPLMPDAIGLAYEDLYINGSDDVRLHGWKLRAENKTAGSILFFHGNGDNVSTQLPNTYWLPEQGFDVYIYDYRQYGKSQGSVDLDKTIEDMELMIAHTVQQLADNEKLIVMGHSLGASMSIYAVAHSNYRDRIKALVTVEAFSDYHDITRDVLAKSWLFWVLQWPLSFTVDNTYRPLDAIGLISPIPILILHSETDEIIDIYHAESLFEGANEPKSFQLIDSDHSNVFIDEKNRQVLLDYLKALK